MKRVVSVSLGSSSRNKSSQAHILGEDFLIERIGTDGDMGKFRQMMLDLEPEVAAFGVGGADIYVVAGTKRYAFREILQLIKGVKTPVVDGAGLKHTLERRTIEWLQSQGVVDFAKESVLLMSAVDRYGMAEALDKVCPKVIYGDLMFGLGLPLPLRSHAAVTRVGKLVLPLITKLPFKWFYPTGEKQEKRTPKFPNAFAESTIIAGDSLYILRYAPDQLTGKTLITQSIRKQNIEWLKSAGLRRIITTTPVIEGETFATNVMEAVIVAHLGKRPEELTEKDYLSILDELAWSPNIIDLNPAPSDSSATG